MPLQIAIFSKLAGVLLLINATVIHAQTLAIRGVVKSEAGSEAIPFAAVALKGKKEGATADAGGKFSLILKSLYPNDTLVFSAIGYHDLFLPAESLLSGTIESTGIKRTPGTDEYTFLLKPRRMELKTVEVKAKSVKWREAKVGYNIDGGTSFQHEFEPLDTLLEGVRGQEIGNCFYFKQYPAVLKDFNFGLHGSGRLPVMVRLRFYSIKDNLPYQKLAVKDVIVKVPPHYTGWIKVNLEKYNISVNQDFAIALEWINEANKLTKNSLMTFARVPKKQVTFYRETGTEPWRKLRSMSIGMYVTLLHE